MDSSACSKHMWSLVEEENLYLERDDGGWRLVLRACAAGGGMLHSVSEILVVDDMKH